MTTTDEKDRLEGRICFCFGERIYALSRLQRAKPAFGFPRRGAPDWIGVGFQPAGLFRDGLIRGIVNMQGEVFI